MATWRRHEQGRLRFGARRRERDPRENMATLPPKARYRPVHAAERADQKAKRGAEKPRRSLVAA
jgi:hypothetical protein